MVFPDVAVGEAVSLLGPFVDFGVQEQERACCFGVYVSHVTRLFILPRGQRRREVFWSGLRHGCAVVVGIQAQLQQLYATMQVRSL